MEKVLRNFMSLPVFILCVTGIIIFSNALFNNFVSDDILQIVKSPLVHSLNNIPLFFISSLRDIKRHGIFVDFYYKPIMFSLYSLLYTIAKGSPIPFHIFQLCIH